MMGSTNRGSRFCRRHTPASLTRLVLLTLLGLLAPAAFPSEADTSADEELQLLQVDTRVFLGILPKTHDYQSLLQGFEVVVDLRFPYEGVYSELGNLRNSGIRHINIPTSSGRLTSATVESFEAVLAEYPEQKIVVHDSNGHRSAMLWAGHLVSLGNTPQDAYNRVAEFYDSIDLLSKLEDYQLEIAN